MKELMMRLAVWLAAELMLAGTGMRRRARV